MSELGNVVIVGAGPVGVLQALFLLRYHAIRCRSIHLYDRRKTSRPEPGRSINLALSMRGMDALRAVDALDCVLADAVPMYGRFIHPPAPQSSAFVQPYGVAPVDAIYSVNRGQIHATLLELLRHRDTNAQVHIHLAHRLLHLDTDTLQLEFLNEEDNTSVCQPADTLFGCDGAFSRVRAELLRQHPGRFVQEHFAHGYREIGVAARRDTDGTASFAFPDNYLHIWPRNDFMLIALPNQDKTFTATLFYDQFDKLTTSHHILHFFHTHFPDFAIAVSDKQLLAAFDTTQPASVLVTMRMEPLAHGRIVLLGDAAHAILPFYGQGLNAGFEDIQLLNMHLLQQAIVPPSTTDTISIRMSQYARLRLRDARAVDELARENYREMRRDVVRDTFRIRCLVLLWLHRWLPRLILPRYTMIAFTHIPYAQIMLRERVQDWCIGALFIAFLIAAFSLAVCRIMA